MLAIPDRFASEMHALKPRKPSVPLRRLVYEAVVLAGFVEAHWEPHRSGRAPLPGLRAAAEAAGAPREVARDLRELASAVQVADADLRATQLKVAPLPVAEATRVLGELREPLRFVLSARVATRGVLERLEGRKQATSAHALALTLEAHAALAEEHTAELARLGDFSADLPERARRLARSLREPRRALSRHGQLRARDALVTLLLERMRTVRTLVRFVFREHPALVRKATSDYERKRKRKNARRRATAKKRSATPVNA
jgi:hypothetical protein